MRGTSTFPQWRLVSKSAEIRIPANEITLSRRADVSVAVVGNPNSGKSTLFNRLTGLKQRIGNYPGVTVERHIGILRVDDKSTELVDLSVSKPWVTASETAECALAYARIGDLSTAADLLRWTRTHRRDDGSYWTGIVYPDHIVFPFDEHTSYTAAAVLLAVDSITRTTQASGLFHTLD